MSVFCYIAHKGGYWGGVIVSDLSRPKDLGRFMSDFAKDGFEIISVANREEYKTKLDGMKPWFESPDYKPKRSRKAKGA